MNQAPNKKLFAEPKLVAYGDIRRVTENVGNMGMADGGAGATSKTST